MLTMLIQGKTNNNNKKSGRMFCYSYHLAMPWKSFCMHERAGTVKEVSSLPPGPGSTAAGLIWNLQACSSTMQWKPWARRDVSCCLLQTNHQLSKSSAAHTGCNTHFLAPVRKHIDAFCHHTLKTKSALLLHDQMPFINLLGKISCLPGFLLKTQHNFQGFLAGKHRPLSAGNRRISAPVQFWFALPTPQRNQYS